MAIVADLGSLARLPHIIAEGHVAELAYTGKDIDAARAVRIGLVNDVLADPEARGRRRRRHWRRRSPPTPRIVVQGTKAVLTASEGKPVADGLDYVATWNAGFLQSDDLHRGDDGVHGEAAAAVPRPMRGGSRRGHESAPAAPRPAPASRRPPPASARLRSASIDRLGHHGVHDVLGFVEQVAMSAASPGGSSSRPARPGCRGPSRLGQAPLVLGAVRPGTATAPRERGRARRSEPPLPRRTSGSGSACYSHASARRHDPTLARDGNGHRSVGRCRHGLRASVGPRGFGSARSVRSWLCRRPRRRPVPTPSPVGAARRGSPLAGRVRPIALRAGPATPGTGIGRTPGSGAGPIDASVSPGKAARAIVAAAAVVVAVLVAITVALWEAPGMAAAPKPRRTAQGRVRPPADRRSRKGEKQGRAGPRPVEVADVPRPSSSGAPAGSAPVTLRAQLPASPGAVVTTGLAEGRGLTAAPEASSGPTVRAWLKNRNKPARPRSPVAP